jgi:hypothetical protein
MDCARGLETLTAADRRDLEMQRRVARMPAVVDHRLGPFARDAYLDQSLFPAMVLAEVRAQSALTL